MNLIEKACGRSFGRRPRSGGGLEPCRSSTSAATIGAVMDPETGVYMQSESGNPSAFGVRIGRRFLAGALAGLLSACAAQEASSPDDVDSSLAEPPIASEDREDDSEADGRTLWPSLPSPGAPNVGPGVASSAPERALGESPTGAVERAQTESVPAVESRLVLVEQFFPTGDAATSTLRVEKSFPAEIATAEEFRCEIRVTNISRIFVSDVEVTDFFSDGFELVSSVPGPPTIRSSAAIWSLGELSPGENKRIEVRGRARGSSIAHCTTVEFTSSLCATTRIVDPGLALGIGVPGSLPFCDPIPLKFSVTNPGTGRTSGIVLTVELPEGLETSDGSRDLRHELGTLEPGATRDVVVDVRAARGGEFGLRGRVTGSPNLEVVSDAIPLRVERPELSVAVDAPSKVYLGRSVPFDIHVTNRGEAPAADAVVEFVAPTGTKIVKVSGAGVVSGTTGTWKLGTLEPGAEATLKARVYSDSQTSDTARVTARAVCAEEVTTTAAFEVEGLPALDLDVVDVTDPVTVGEEIVYEITVTNRGSAAGTKIRIECSLEENVTYVSSSGDTPGTREGPTLGFEALPSLAPQGVATWQIVVRAESESDSRFHVRLASEQISRPIEETEATLIYE
jgi:uncharacterized repeat protein (TIGR01451 family)